MGAVERTSQPPLVTTRVIRVAVDTVAVKGVGRTAYKIIAANKLPLKVGMAKEHPCIDNRNDNTTVACCGLPCLRKVHKGIVPLV